jgi:hypothetical protein
MQTFTTPQLREKLKASAEESDSDKIGAAADAIQFLEFSDLDKSVKEEVEFVKTHPLILKETEVTGWVYHVESGKVCGVEFNVYRQGQSDKVLAGPSRGLSFGPGILYHQIDRDHHGDVQNKRGNLPLTRMDDCTSFARRIERCVWSPVDATPKRVSSTGERCSLWLPHSISTATVAQRTSAVTTVAAITFYL